MYDIRKRDFRIFHVVQNGASSLQLRLLFFADGPVSDVVSSFRFFLCRGMDVMTVHLREFSAF